ncbi:MAG: RHS repeat-associated core domain-containing protein [Flavobacteriales bacterium]|nr:RHS repeat-associated core domain-containing protein [Flavobacteriales bacterium]
MFLLCLIPINLKSQNIKNKDLFSSKINYDQANHPNFNGTVSSCEWKVDNQDRLLFDFEYDNHYQLTKDHLFKVNGNQSSSTLGIRQIDYDLNGNIEILARGGQDVFNQTTQVDYLIYSYDDQNRATHVKEMGALDMGYKVTNELGYLTNGEIDYDNNGNIIRLENKDVDIKYNANNLPYQFIFDNRDTLRIYYTTDGRKYLKKSIDRNGNAIGKHYVDDFEYLNGTLESISHKEGRTSRYGTSFQNEFALKDHLGNSRVYFADQDKNGLIKSSEILQEEHYFPFGVEMTDPTITGVENHYKYASKEKVEDFGLDWIDFGARFYDPGMGRWNSVDPLAEKYMTWSPYSYTLNSPMTFVDPDGRQVVDAKGRAVKISRNNDGTLNYEFHEKTKLKHRTKFMNHAGVILEAMSATEMGWQDIQTLMSLDTKVYLKTNHGTLMQGNSVVTPKGFNRKTGQYKKVQIETYLGNHKELSAADMDEWLGSVMNVETAHLIPSQIQLESEGYSGDPRHPLFTKVYQNLLNNAVRYRAKYRTEHGQQMTDEVFSPIEKANDAGANIQYDTDNLELLETYKNNR